MQRQLPSDDRVDATPAVRTATTGDPTPASASRRGLLRFLPGVAIAAVTGLVLTGCGGDEDDGEEDDD